MRTHVSKNSGYASPVAQAGGSYPPVSLKQGAERLSGSATGRTQQAGVIYRPACGPPITNMTCRVLTVEEKAVLAVVVGSSSDNPIGANGLSVMGMASI